MTTVDPQSLPGAASDRQAGLTPGDPRSLGLRTTSRWAKAGAYLALTKPRIIKLLLITTVPTMVLAQGGLPPLGLVLATLLGGALAAGSANTLNMVLDRDIDALMSRTEGRPLVTGALRTREAVLFGLGLGVLATGWLALAVNGLSALLAASAIAFYVLVYTWGLKRRTAQNIVWGGAAGCMPVLIGWAAVTGSLSWAPLVLFGIIFFWTPPHYWPLSMRFKDDYAAAGVPMLSVVADPLVVVQRVVAYSWVMVAVSLLLWPVAGTGPVYAVSAAALGGGFLIEAHRLLRRARRGLTGDQLGPMRLFHASITYLTLLFVVIAVDPLLPF